MFSSEIGLRKIFKYIKRPQRQLKTENFCIRDKKVLKIPCQGSSAGDISGFFLFSRHGTKRHGNISSKAAWIPKQPVYNGSNMVMVIRNSRSSWVHQEEVMLDQPGNLL